MYFVSTCMYSCMMYLAFRSALYLYFLHILVVFAVTITGRINSIAGGSLHLQCIFVLFCRFIHVLITEMFSICLSVAIENRKTICGFIVSLLFLASG